MLILKLDNSNEAIPLLLLNGNKLKIIHLKLLTKLKYIKEYEKLNVESFSE